MPRRSQKRNQEQQTKYIPNYKKMGIDPIKVPINEVSSVDGEDYSTNNIAYNGPMIDNNDFVDLNPNPLKTPFKTVEEKQSEDLEIGNYIILVNGKMLGKGSYQLMQQIATSLLYGDHADFDNPVEIDDIVILKRIGLKFGVFLNE